MSFAMTKQEREAFLADVHVGVLSVPEPGRGPLAVPVWYAYEPGGELRLVTGRTSRKGQLLARAGRVSLCSQTETAPYKYVSVEGPIVAIEAADLERDLRLLARRYLGRERAATSTSRAPGRSTPTTCSSAYARSAGSPWTSRRARPRQPPPSRSGCSGQAPRLPYVRQYLAHMKAREQTWLTTADVIHELFEGRAPSDHPTGRTRAGS